MTEKRLDILILGASGFTGIHCIPYVHKLSKNNGRSLTWGVAGRSKDKLRDALDKMGKNIGADLSTIPIIITDISRDDSLLKMAERTKLVINCCGPFRDLGAPVVKACIAAGTHHIDVSGEPQYMEEMQLDQNQNAEEKGVYVVSACGFDSVPNDLGVIFMQQNFDGVLNSVETYLEMWEEGNSAGPSLNIGTWDSAVHRVHGTGVEDLRKKLFPRALPTLYPRLERKILPHKSNVVDGWILPFPGADFSVMTRTQRFLYDEESRRPIQMNTYFVVKSIFNVMLLAIVGAIFAILSNFDFGRKLLMNYPELFSGGMFSKNEPSEEKIEKTWFQITFYGEGWSERLEDERDNYTIPCDKSILGRVKGRNPAYGSACISLVCAAIIVLTESDKMPKGGGVFPPGAAFKNTSFIKLLNENGVTFEIISQKNL